ncbi:MAG: pyrroline-5-carboxylate reductase [Sediminispirochaetaceae bacterium]
MNTFGIIGAGNMGRAFGIGLNAKHPEIGIRFYDVDREKAERTAGECGGTVCSTTSELAEASDTLLIAVKPQQLDTLCSEVAPKGNGKSFISIAAGTPISYFEGHLKNRRIIRFMPNLAATVGASVVGIAYGAGADDAFRQDACTVASAVGIPVELPERLLSAITGLSGSGLAYVFAFLHALALGGTDAGFTYEQALEIAYGTAEGAVKLLRTEGAVPSEYLTRVCSAGGTTIRGVKALEKGGFTHTVMEAVAAAARRAEEIEASMR